MRSYFFSPTYTIKWMNPVDSECGGIFIGSIHFCWFHFFLLFTLFCVFLNWNVIISTIVHDNNWRLAIVNWRLLCSFLNIFVNELQYSVFINKIKNDRIRDKKRFIKNRSSRMWWHIHIEIDLFISLCLYNIAISRIDIDNEYGMKILLAFFN